MEFHFQRIQCISLQSILLYKTKSRNFKSHGLKAVGHLDEPIRAQWTDFFMVCNMATKKTDFRKNRLRKSGLKSLKSSPVYIFWPNLMNYGYCIHLAKVFGSYY